MSDPGASNATAARPAELHERSRRRSFASFVAVGTLLERPLSAILAAAEATTHLEAHLARVDDIWMQAPEATGDADPGRLSGELTFDRVSFRYGDTTVLDDVSFRVRPGERVAVVVCGANTDPTTLG